MTLCSDATSALDEASAARYVLSRLTPQGGYCFYRTPQWGVDEPNARDTLAALESLRLLGVAPPRPAATARWLRGLQAADGGYPTLTIGWSALRALSVLGSGPQHSPREWLDRCRRQLAHWQGPRDWREAIREAHHVLELLRLEQQQLEADEHLALAKLLELAGDDGGWARPGADLETTAIAVELLRLARPRGSAGRAPLTAESFLRRCEDRVLGVRVAPDAGATSVGALWGATAIARGLHVSLRYPSAIGQGIVLLQGHSGGLGSRHRAIPTLHDTWLGLRAASQLARIQEASR
jgi:Prenyltransferase and squalene oxidase repeat